MKLGAVMGLVVPDSGADPLLGRIEKAHSLGLRVMGLNLRDQNRDPGYLRSVSDLAAAKDVELRFGGVGANFYLTGSAGAAEVQRAADAIGFARDHVGIRFTSLPGGPILTTHRWTSGPPLEERLAVLAENLGRLADAVGDVVLGLENHCDWRGHEIAQVVRTANRKNLLVQIDTGNAFSVFEEPIDCAEALAPYTVSVHLKDVAVTPFASGDVRGTRAVSVPLGEGHVDNARIVDILSERAPDPTSIGLMVEPFYMPEDTSPDAFLRTSLTWARQHLARHIA